MHLPLESENSHFFSKLIGWKLKKEKNKRTCSWKKLFFSFFSFFLRGTELEILVGGPGETKFVSRFSNLRCLPEKT